MSLISDTSKIDKILDSEARNLKLKKRQFSIFGYNTIFKHKKISDFKKDKKHISRERALFPTMNPNLFGGLPSIFSCKPRLRVSLNPGDVIFCIPNKTNMANYYANIKKEDPPKRCITLVMIVIKKINLQNAFEQLSFKACNIKMNIIKDDECEYMTFAPDLKQAGDITVKYKEGNWEYAGNENDSHHHNNDNVKSLNYKFCSYRHYLDDLTEDKRPFSNLGCKKLKCKSYKRECKMKSGNWKYDILFKWGLLGSLKKSIPLEFRSFYLGSKGWTLKKFAEEIGAPKILGNTRWVESEELNKNGPEVLRNLREDFEVN